MDANFAFRNLQEKICLGNKLARFDILVQTLREMHCWQEFLPNFAQFVIPKTKVAIALHVYQILLYLKLKTEVQKTKINLHWRNSEICATVKYNTNIE